MPEDRLERKILWGWLPDHNGKKARRGATSTRRQLWARMGDIMTIARVAKDKWAEEWVGMARKEGGVEWKGLVKACVKEKEGVEGKRMWSEKHKGEAEEGRRAAAH